VRWTREPLDYSRGRFGAEDSRASAQQEQRADRLDRASVVFQIKKSGAALIERAATILGTDAVSAYVEYAWQRAMGWWRAWISRRGSWRR
jgi:hypothetical protein